LPTEVEWEYAARGGLEGQLFPWGDDAPVCDDQAVNGALFETCQPDDTSAVSGYNRNGYGLFNMAGNVWEWVSSLLQPYPYDMNDGREDLEISGKRVLRGGSWSTSGFSLRVANRMSNDPTFAGSDVGFRCAVSP
jgi:formylglycine-generating enzyme required for sulfatase activity